MVKTEKEKEKDKTTTNQKSIRKKEEEN